MRLLIDTNILLDVLYDRIPFTSSSTKLIDRVFRGEHVGLVAVHTVTTIHYTIAKNLGIPKANEAVDWILMHFTIATANGQVLQRARHIGSIDFEDAVVIATAEAAQAEVIVTRDSRGFVASAMPVLSPYEFLEKYHPQS